MRNVSLQDIKAGSEKDARHQAQHQKRNKKLERESLELRLQFINKGEIYGGRDNKKLPMQLIEVPCFKASSCRLSATGSQLMTMRVLIDRLHAFLLLQRAAPRYG